MHQYVPRDMRCDVGFHNKYIQDVVNHTYVDNTAGRNLSITSEQLRNLSHYWVYSDISHNVSFVAMRIRNFIISVNPSYQFS